MGRAGRGRGALVRALCALAAAAGCGFDDSKVGGEAACVQGMSSRCECSDGASGNQTCGSDGSYGPCACDGDDSSGGRGSDGVGGTSAVDTSGAGSGAAGRPSGRAGASGEAGTSGSGQAGEGAAGGGAAGTGAGGSGAGGADAGSGAGSGGSAGSSGTCTPGALGCAQVSGVDVVTQCNAEGTEAVQIKMCGVTTFCQDGACVAQKCPRGQLHCVEDELRRCNARGAGYEVVQTCDDDERCDAGERACVADCSPEPCTCMVTFSPCCTDNGACGCALLGSGECGATGVTGPEACTCP